MLGGVAEDDAPPFSSKIRAGSRSRAAQPKLLISAEPTSASLTG